MKQRQSQRQVVIVNVHAEKQPRGRKRTATRRRRVPPRPRVAHIVPPTVQVVQERWFQPQWNQPVAPQIPQTSTGHTVIPEVVKKWGVSSTQSEEHPFVGFVATTPEPSSVPFSEPPSPMMSETVVATIEDEPAPPPATTTAVMNRTQLIAKLSEKGIRGVQNLRRDELLAIAMAEDTVGKAAQIKKSKKYKPY